MANAKLSALATGTTPEYYYGIEGGASKKYNGLGFRNVLDYGASTAIANNGPAFTSAISAGGTVSVPPGTYPFTEGINVDSLGGNGSFSLVGCGDASILSASMDDFIFRKVARATGAVSACREIRNIKINNTKLTLAGTANISTASWSASGASGPFTGFPVVTVTTSSAHGFTVGQYRLMQLASIVPSAYNSPETSGLAGVYFNSSTQFQFYLLSDPGTYVSGGTYAPRGGGVSMMSYYGGALYNVNMSGYHAGYFASDCTTKLFNCAAIGSGNAGIGFWTAGQTGYYGCDVTGFDTGIKCNPTGCLGFTYSGGALK